MYKGKAIYNPSGKDGEYTYWACNFYNGCSHGCKYCYLQQGVLKKVMGGSEPTLKACFHDYDDALNIFKKELLDNLQDLRKHDLFFSFSTDPFLKNTIDLTHDAIGIAQYYEIPVKVLTKATWWVDDLIIDWETYHDHKQDLIAYGFTLTGHDELEPNAGSNMDRLVSMLRLHQRGFKTFASVEPIIDFKSSLDVIRASVGSCDLYKIGLENGKEYDRTEAVNFIVDVLKVIPQKHKIYFKDSLLKLVGETRENLNKAYPNCVNRNYDMFLDGTI